MEIYEHHKLNSAGELEGLYTVDINKGSFSHQDFWSRVDEIVAEYTKLHPMEMEITVRDNLNYSGNQLRKHGLGASKDLELRHHMRIPVGLLRTLEAYSPDLFEKKENYHKFMKRYKGLCAWS